VEDAVEEEGVVLELALEQAEVAAVQLDPEAFTLQVLQPAGPQVAPPVTLHPASDGRLAEVAAGLLALDPLETEGLLLPIDVNARLFHGTGPLPRAATGRVAPPPPAVAPDGSMACNPTVQFRPVQESTHLSRQSAVRRQETLGFWT